MVSEQRILGENDEAPYVLFNEEASSPYILTCEHAGYLIPDSLGDLGLPNNELTRHIGWDIGIEPLALHLAEILDATLILQYYSRLVIDCNRPRSSPDLVPMQSDGTNIPRNVGISDHHRGRRIEEIHDPYHRELEAVIDRRLSAGRTTAVVSLHSFTPKLRSEADSRPWDVGLLHDKDDRLTQVLSAMFREAKPMLNIGVNEPYTVEPHTDMTIPVHGDNRGLMNLLIEIRNDHLSSGQVAEEWARLLAEMFVEALDNRNY